MLRKIFKGIIVPTMLVCFVLVLAACSGGSETISTPTYTIAWEVNGTVVETDSNVKEGIMPNYDGTKPVKTDIQYEYTFTGWTPELTNVTQNQKYTAIFVQGEIKEYTITWKDTDDSILGTTTVAYGAMPTYNLPEDTDQWDYTGWTPSVESATGTVTYKALRELQKYTITWKNADNTVLGTQEVDYGTFPSRILPGDTIEWDYTGWTPNLVAVTENSTFTAVRKLQEYTITWKDADDSILGTTTVTYGAMPTYNLPEDTDQWDYTGWTPVLVAATGVKTYTAVRDDIRFKIDNEVIIDNEDLNITIIETYEDDIWGYSLKVYLENKTSDKELRFRFDDVIVNGYVISAYFSYSLPAGTKAIKTVSLSSSDLEESGITSVDKIELYIRVYDSNDWSADDLVDNRYIIYPTGLSEEDIVSPERPSSDTEYILIDNEFVTFIIIETYEDSIWGYSLKIYLENKTDSELMFTWDDVSVNDFIIDPYWATTLMPNSKYISSISFSESDFEESNIEIVEKIVFKLKIYDSNDWMADDLVNSIYTYRP